MVRTGSHGLAAVLLMTLTFSTAATPGWAQRVKTDFSRSTNFAALRTYYWAKSDAIPNNDLMNDRLVAAVDQWLAAKGWRKLPPSEADVAIVANVAAEEKQDITTIYNGWIATTTARNYIVATIIIDLMDARTDKLIWRGTSTDTVSDDPNKNTKRIQKGVAKMFKEFPPVPKRVLRP